METPWHLHQCQDTAHTDQLRFRESPLASHISHMCLFKLLSGNNKTNPVKVERSLAWCCLLKVALSWNLYSCFYSLASGSQRGAGHEGQPWPRDQKRLSLDKPRQMGQIAIYKHSIREVRPVLSPKSCLNYRQRWHENIKLTRNKMMLKIGSFASNRRSGVVFEQLSPGKKQSGFKTELHWFKPRIKQTWLLAGKCSQEFNHPCAISTFLEHLWMTQRELNHQGILQGWQQIHTAQVEQELCGTDTTKVDFPLQRSLHRSFLVSPLQIKPKGFFAPKALSNQCMCPWRVS